MKEINKQYIQNQKLYNCIYETQKLYRDNNKVKKALLRWPKKRYCNLSEMDQIRIAKKLLPLIQ